MQNIKTKRSEILKPHLYFSDDTEPLESLVSIYTFTKITETNQYDYETVLRSLTTFGFMEVISPLLVWLSDMSSDEDGYPLGAGSNLMEAFSSCLKDTNYLEHIILPAVKGLSQPNRLELSMLIANSLSSATLDDPDISTFKEFLNILDK